MPMFSVLLLIPDYAAEDYGTHTYYSFATAATVQEAIAAVRQECMDDHTPDDDACAIDDADDLYVLLATEGGHPNLMFRGEPV